MLKGVKKASLWVLSRGRVPSSRMTHKVYRWMSPEGRSVSPPPDPFDLQDQTNIGERGVMNEADERKVRYVNLHCYIFHSTNLLQNLYTEGSIRNTYLAYRM